MRALELAFAGVGFRDLGIVHFIAQRGTDQLFGVGFGLPPSGIFGLPARLHAIGFFVVGLWVCLLRPLLAHFGHCTFGATLACAKLLPLGLRGFGLGFPSSGAHAVLAQLLMHGPSFVGLGSLTFGLAHVTQELHSTWLELSGDGLVLN